MSKAELFVLVDRASKAISKLEQKMKSIPGCRPFKCDEFTFDKINGAWRIGYDGRPLQECPYAQRLTFATRAKMFYETYIGQTQQQVVSDLVDVARVSVPELEALVDDIKTD